MVDQPGEIGIVLSLESHEPMRGSIHQIGVRNSVQVDNYWVFFPMGSKEKAKPWNVFRYWLMQRLVPSSTITDVARIVGRHYSIVSVIFRLLGAKIGKYVYWPGSGLEIVEFDLLEIGDNVTFGSRSIVMTSSAEGSKKVMFESGTMIADRCVVLPGVTLRRGSVLGSGSLAREYITQLMAL